MTKRKKTEIVGLKLRLRESLRRQIETAAKAQERSLNSEVVARLEVSFLRDRSREEREEVIASMRRNEEVLTAVSGMYAIMYRELKRKTGAGTGWLAERMGPAHEAERKSLVAALQETIKTLEELDEPDSGLAAGTGEESKPVSTQRPIKGGKL
jgi:hypothetical protein